MPWHLSHGDYLGLGYIPWPWLPIDWVAMALVASMSWLWQGTHRVTLALVACPRQRALTLEAACLDLLYEPVGLPCPWKHACFVSQPMGAAFAMAACSWVCPGLCSMPMGAAMASAAYLGLGYMLLGYLGLGNMHALAMEAIPWQRALALVMRLLLLPWP